LQQIRFGRARLGLLFRKEDDQGFCLRPAGGLDIRIGRYPPLIGSDGRALPPAALPGRPAASFQSASGGRSGSLSAPPLKSEPSDRLL
jgi:hypothetical protein